MDLFGNFQSANFKGTITNSQDIRQTESCLIKPPDDLFLKAEFHRSVNITCQKTDVSVVGIRFWLQGLPPSEQKCDEIVLANMMF